MRVYCARLSFASPEDRQRLIQTLEAQRAMFNECSKDLFELRRKQGRVSIVDLHHVSYRRIREMYPEVPSQIVIRAEHDAKAAYQASYSMAHELTQPAVKQRLSLQLDERIYSWKGHDIYLTAVGGKRIQCGIEMYPRLREMFGSHEVRDPLVFVRNGEIWLSVPFAVPEPLHMENHCIGIDLGCRLLAATSEGKAISGKELAKHKRRVRYLRRTLKSKMMLGSKSAGRHLKKIRVCEAHYALNYTHHIANELLKTDANTLVMEDLAGMKKRKGNTRASQIPFFLFKTLLTYKAQARGKRVVTVPARDTSKDDSRGLPRGDRVGRRYYATDGLILDAELNAAINIGARWSKRSQHPVSLVMPFDGSLKPLGQADVNRPIVGGMVLMSDHRDGVALQAFTGS